MTLSEHKITATVIPVAGTNPAYSVDRPAVLLGTSQGATGFVAPTGTRRTAFNGPHARGGSGNATLLANNTSGNTGPFVTGQQIFTGSVTNLTVGVAHTLSIWHGGYAAGNHIVEIGVSGFGYGPATVTPNNTDGSGYTEAVYTFTPTAVSHTINLRVDFGSSATFRPMLTDDFTVTRNAYTENFPAVAVPATPIPLDVIEGTVTMDASYQPYIRATLTCHVPSNVTLLEQIDPRVTGVRVQVHTEANYLGTRPSTVRDFDLVLRGRSVDPDTGNMEITLASEEALLQDKRLVAFNSERVYGLSVKTAVDFALAKIGKTVAAGWTDANVVTDAVPAPATNLLYNGSFSSNTTGWTPGGTGGTLTRVTGDTTAPFQSPNNAHGRVTFSTAGASGGPFYNTGVPNLSGGERYRLTAWVRSNVAARISPNIEWYNASNANIGSTLGSTFVLKPNVWTKISHTHTAPATATRGGLYVYNTDGFTWAANARIDIDGVSLSFGDDEIEFFEGSMPETPLATYAWVGTPYASSSTRVFKPNTDAMILRPGKSLSDYLEPLLNSTGLRLYADETRAWRLVPQGTMTEGQVNVSPLNGLTQTSDDINRDDDTWFDSVVVRYFWNDADGKEQEAYDFAGAPGTKTMFVEINTRIPKFGAAQAYLAAALGKGRTYDIEAVSDYWAIPGKQVVLSVPGLISAVGIITSVAFDFPSGEMSIGTRGIVDTPLTSWLFAPTGRKWQDIAVGVTWNTYTN